MVIVAVGNALRVVAALYREPHLVHRVLLLQVCCCVG